MPGTSKRFLAWALLIGGIGVAVFYAIFFYYFLGSSHTFEVSYPEGYDIHGIDISRYQGDIDWRMVRESGSINDCPISFVIIKATEGADRVDEKFEYNFNQSREHGFMRGVYHFYSTKSSAEKQARHFISHVTLDCGDLPPVLDVEQKPRTQTEQEFREGVLRWLDIIEKHYGVTPIIYTYYHFKLRYLNDPAFDSYPHWIAHYNVDSLEYQGAWKFWQHTDAGSLSGISGPVDLNIFNGSYADLQQLTINAPKSLDQ